MSRELDAQVAEKIMGWTLADRPEYGWPISPPPSVPPVKIAPYSTNIAAAWQVVEKMREKGWKAIRVHYVGGLWSVGFDRESWAPRSPMGSGSVWELASSAPEAVCLAALKAVSP